MNAVKGHYPRPLDEPSKKGRATVARPSASLPKEVSRRCGSQKLAVLGGNDPHSYGVTSHRASMNTLRPNIVSFADALFAMLNGIICKFTVYTHSYSGMIKPMAYISKTNNIKNSLYENT